MHSFTAITMTTIASTIASGIHSGAVTHHHDQPMTPHSLSTRKTTNNTPPRPIPELALLELLTVCLLSMRSANKALQFTSLRSETELDRYRNSTPCFDVCVGIALSAFSSFTLFDFGHSSQCVCPQFWH